MTTQSPDVEVLHPETSHSETALADVSSTPPGARCQHRYANGKRCRLPGLESQAGLCSHHFHLKVAASLPPSSNDYADLTKDLLPGGTQFSSTEDLRDFLTRLLILMTQGGVSPRRAAVLAYITNQLLHTHVVVEKELDDHQQIIFDLPRPKRD